MERGHLILAYVVLCVAVNVWAIDMAFNRKPWDIKEAAEDSAKPWRFPARIAFAAIIMVGSLTSIGYLAIRSRD